MKPRDHTGRNRAERKGKDGGRLPFHVMSRGGRTIGCQSGLPKGLFWTFFLAILQGLARSHVLHDRFRQVGRVGDVLTLDNY